MRRYKVAGIFCIYLVVLWHAYALLIRPLHGYGVSLPLFSSVQFYSQKLLLYPKWSFFYFIPETNVRVQYTTDTAPELVREFYGPSESYQKRMRAYRCGACGNAAYQLLFRDETPENGWLLGSFLCRLEPDASLIRARLAAAAFDSYEFKPAKEVSLRCHDFRN